MINSFLLFFNENVIILRTIVYTFGWVVLSLSTIVLIYKSIKLHRKIKHLVFGKLIVPTLVGWLITMHSLGTVCTFYVFDMPRKGMIVTLPIFFLWIVTMIVVFLITSKWGNEAIKHYKNIIRLNKELEKANKRLRQLDNLKSEFITITTHQLRTPLTGMKWIFSSFINGDFGEINETQKNILKKGDTANERILKIINNLLEVKKIESGILGYNFKKASIKRIAEDVINNFSLIIEKKKISLHLIKPEESIPDAVIDSIKINIVFSILIENALNYTPKGGEVKVILENLGDNFKATVEDNGIGIPDNEKERIFSYFFRGEKAIKIQTDGIGLGLYIANNIIKMHKGKIGFKSQEDKGSIFYFTIPFK